MNKIPKKVSDAELFCISIEPTGKDVYINDSEIPGLFLRVTPSGKKVWQLRYSIKIGDKWKSKKTSLGAFKKQTKDKNYVTVGLTVSVARNSAEKIKADIKANNIDPVEKKRAIARVRLDEKLEEENKKLKLITVSELFERWSHVVLIKYKDKGESVRELMTSKVLNQYGQLSAQDFAKAQIMNITDDLLSEGKQRMAKRTFSLIRQMMRFAEIRDIIESDPTHKIDKKQIGGQDVERKRVVCSTDDKPDELKELLKLIPISGLPKTSQIGLHICLATCCRIGELMKAEWKHINFNNRYWLIPEENSKNGNPHAIYLNDFAIEYLKQLESLTKWSRWLFPSPKIDGPVGTRNITKQVDDRQKPAGTNLKNRTKNSQSLMLPHGKWTPHDLRRTAATLMVELGAMPEVVERCLNHEEENKVKRTYQRFSYKPQMKIAWELLGEHLLSLEVAEQDI